MSSSKNGPRGVVVPAVMANEIEPSIVKKNRKPAVQSHNMS